MKKNLFAVLMLTALLATSCKKEITDEPGSLSNYKRTGHAAHLQDSVQSVVDKYVAIGIPGIHVVVKNDHEIFTANAGYSDVERQIPMLPNETDLIFSITKTYTAALVMKEVEKGTIVLDRKIKFYLSNNDATNIPGSDVIAVRMLLSHTSGIIDFTSLPEFINGQFEHPLQQPSVDEKLAMLYDKALNFQPGSDFEYSNSNFLILYKILENVSGKSFKSLLQNEIIDPLQLDNTWFEINSLEAKRLHFPNYYFDPTGTGELVNATAWNFALGNTSLAYGGISATAKDVIRFYEALINGNVVTEKSFKAMTTWVQGQGSTQPDYGLGLEYYQFAPGTTPQYGHEGDGIGCTTQIMYVPDTHTYLYINCTVGRKIPGPFFYKTTDFKNELCRLVAGWR